MFFEKNKFSVLVRDYGNLVLKSVNFKFNGLFFSVVKLFGILNGYVEDVVDLFFFIGRNVYNINFGYNENLLDEEVRKVKRKGFL